MSITLISALMLSIAMHAALVFFGPGIRPAHVEEYKEDTVDVEMVTRKVPIPDALRLKPLPQVPEPKPLDLNRLLAGRGASLGRAAPRLRVKPQVPIPKQIPKTPLITGLPKLNLPRPVTPVDSLALQKAGGGAPLAPGDIALPVGKPGKGKGLSGKRKPVLGRSAKNIRLKEEISSLSVTGRERVRRQRIRGPAAARRIVFRPPPPKVKIFESSGDIELRFWVLADGTVGRVIPFRKGSAYLEGLAVNHMKRWRFSPLRPDEPKREEWGLVVYRFRVR